METVAHLVPKVRDSVCAIMRVAKQTIHRGKKKSPVIQFKVGFAGTAWCIVANRYLVTAHHVFNGLGTARDPADLFYAFIVPGNGQLGFQFPVIGFPVEEPAVDLAVLEVGSPVAAGQQIPVVAVTVTRPPDGTSVLTYGFPSPAVAGANLAPDGKFLGGGQFFLKGHANEGIVAAQYDADNAWHFEFNVGWHQGESGGPVFQLEPLAVFAVMQHYRNIQAPHGIVAGPHRGRALDKIVDRLASLGATII